MAFSAARRNITSVDLIVYRRARQTGGSVTASLLADGPSGALMVHHTACGLSRGRLAGYHLLTTARWPDGRQRSRAGVVLQRVSMPAFPVAGGDSGGWLSQEPVRIRLARPSEQTFGYVTPDDPEAQAADVARLIGLVPSAISSSAGSNPEADPDRPASKAEAEE